MWTQAVFPQSQFVLSHYPPPISETMEVLIGTREWGFCPWVLREQEQGDISQKLAVILGLLRSSTWVPGSLPGSLYSTCAVVCHGTVCEYVWGKWIPGTTCISSLTLWIELEGLFFFFFSSGDGNIYYVRYDLFGLMKWLCFHLGAVFFTATWSEICCLRKH